MSIINATIAAGTRRMLQDVLAWHTARGHDIGRVNAMAAAGLIPKDASGNVQVPQDVLNALWRPFPGSSQAISVTNLGGDQGAAAPTATSTPATAAPTSPASPAPTPSGQTPAAPMAVTAGLPAWLKTAAALLALTGGVGGIGGAGALIASWLSKPAATTTQPAAPAQQQPSWLAPEVEYELHLGPPAQPAAQTGGQPNG